MDSKRIRFGFVCGHTNFVNAEMLPSIRIQSMECALASNGKQYVVFTVSKPMKACDVLKSIHEFNEKATEPLVLEPFKVDGMAEDASGLMIVTFEKGQRFLQHPFYAIIQELKIQDGRESSSSPKVWEWTADGMPVSSRHKRVVGELVSDLVQDAILPSAPKRGRGGHKNAAQEVIQLLLLRFYCNVCVDIG